MKKIYLLVFSIIVVACGPSINPALQQQVGTYFNKSSSKTYNMSGDFDKPMPYAAGQWVEMATRDGDGRRSISRTSIIGKEDGGWIIETYSLSEYNESVTQMLVKGLEDVAATGDIEDIELVWIKIKDETGQVVKQEGAMLSIVKGLYKDMLNGFQFSNSGMTMGESVAVPAGIFKGSGKVRATAKILGKKFETDAWYHKDVPINGLVKTISTDNRVVSELIDFGVNGAKSEF